MNKEDIIRMAREHLVKCEYTEFGWQDCHRYEFDDDELLQFAALVVAAVAPVCGNSARLIAAAPDLLAALQRLTHPAADDTDLQHALDVIARATGK